MTFQYPLKLISPSPTAAQKSVLVFLLTYGGGLVGGDEIDFTIEIRPHARLALATQGHTKIFKSPSPDVITRQTLHLTLEAGAAVCLLPDPVQPFEGSLYEQRQVFQLEESSSVCLLDWVSAGRTARGECWDVRGWSGRNEIWAAPVAVGEKKRLLLRDNLLLKGGATAFETDALRMKMHELCIFGTLILKGALVESLATFFLAEFAALPRIGSRDFRSDLKKERDGKIVMSREEAWRSERLAQEKEDGLLWSAAKVRGCTVVKFGARTVEGARTWIGAMMKEEGSIAREFGADALICIR